MSAITLKNIQIGSRQQLPQLRSAGRRGLRCSAEAGNSTGAAKVKFSVTQHVEFGQQVEVTGEAPVANIANPNRNGFPGMRTIVKLSEFGCGCLRCVVVISLVLVLLSDLSNK